MVTLNMLYRLAVYTPDGPFKGYLDGLSSWSASLPVNDLGSLKIKCVAGSSASGLLAGPCEVAIQVWNGSKWIEPVNGRYMRVEASTDKASGDASMIDYTLVSYGKLLDSVLVVPAKFGKPEHYDKDGKRAFLSATAGQIINAIFSEARGLVDGLVPGLEQRFSPTMDANGAKWAKHRTLYLEPGTSVLTVLDSLSSRGLIEWRMNGRRLEIANPGSWSMKTGVELVREEGSEVPMRSTLGGLLHTAFLLGDGGETWRVDNPGAPTPWGKTMKVLTQGGVKDEQTAKAMIQAELDAGSRERFEYTWQTQVDNLAWIPLIHVSAGDWVKFRGPGEVLDVRIFQIVLSVDGEVTKVAFTLNDRFEDAQVRAAKRIKGITNGASGDAGTGSLPTRAERAEPARPVGLVAESEGYWEGDIPRSLVRVSFAPVVLDVHGLGIDIAHYEVKVAGKLTTSTKHNGVVVDGLAPDKTVTVEVVAVSRDGVRSEAALLNVTTVAPDVKLAPPTKLVGDADYGMVNLHWDRKLQYKGGQPYDPPTHFAHIEVEESADQRSWQIVGTARAGGITLDRESAVGETRYYRAWTVNKLGKRSDDPSPVTVVRVASHIRSEIETVRKEIGKRAQELIHDERGSIMKQLEERLSGKITGTVDISRLTATGRVSEQVIDRLWAGGIATRSLSANTAVLKELIVASEGKPIDGVRIKDGTIDTSKIRGLEAAFLKIDVDRLLAGKITSKMFSTTAGFNGPGVAVSGTQIVVKGHNGGKVWMNDNGLWATDRSGNISFEINADGSANFNGNITSKATITGALIRTGVSGRRLELSGTTLSSYDYSGNKTMELDPDGLEFWKSDVHVGNMRSSSWHNRPEVRGIANQIDYTADYVTWSYRETPTADTYTAFLTMDPKGRIWGRPGIKIDLPIVCGGRDITPYYDPRVEFGLQKLDGNNFPALQHVSGNTAIAFGNTDMYFVINNTYYSIRNMLSKIGY